VPTSLGDLLLSFELVSSNGGGQHEAFLHRPTGKIHWRSDSLDLEELEDALPENVEEDIDYIAVPGKQDLDLGKPLVLAFAREFLPNDLDDVRDIFDRPGAYKKFRALLIRRHALERWYKFESENTERALREWCELNSIELAD
jgi:hypothetical protein